MCQDRASNGGSEPRTVSLGRSGWRCIRVKGSDPVVLHKDQLKQPEVETAPQVDQC